MKYKKERRAKKKIKANRTQSAKQPSKEVRTGIFISHPKGFGFVEFADRDEEDLFVPAPYVENAFHKDEVEVELLPEQKGKRREGRILRILDHGITEVVGTFSKSTSFGFVIPDNTKITKDIFVPKECAKHASTGDKVVVRIKSYGDKKKSPEGKIIEVLGKESDPGVDVLSVARAYEIPMEFPPRVLKQADRCPDHVLESDHCGRLDLRSWQMVTIDGEDAKDLDDAVSLSMEDGLYKLGVHIADVTNYVQATSALDREAKKRGTSVYLVDRVVPMLPKALSNGICSLNAGEDRLALSCIMWIDKNGTLRKHQIAETVIHVDRRMTYTEVDRILAKEDPELLLEYRECVPMFFMMKQLSDLLRKRRRQRGAISFEFPECKILLNKNGKPIDIRIHERNAATDLIEDFMLQANETVAEEFCRHKIPFLYRSHENPEEDRIEEVLSFIRRQGISAEKEKQEITPLEIQAVQDQIKGHPMEPLISRLLLRSMKQARYTTQCIGHFGLAAPYYCHFTSPIRRYPDLQIHRIIKDCIRGRMNEEKAQEYSAFLDETAQHCSETERRAEEVERETEKMKKAEYMQYHFGEVCEGRISGVTAYGIYVELPNTVEGMIPVQTMRDDFYVFDEENFQMVGEMTKKTYRLGDVVSIRVKEADVHRKTIDFSLDETGGWDE